MSKVIDLRDNGGELVILGKALVLPSSASDGTDVPLDGSIRFNPTAGIVEMCLAGTWTLLSGSGGGGGGSSSTVPISNVVGLQTTLNNKAPLIHTHAIAEVVNLQATLDNKSNLDHGHSLTSIPNLQPTLTSLQNQIDAKSAIGHTHVIANVTGLQTLLDVKANLTHTHEIANVTGLQTVIDGLKKEKIGFCLPTIAPAGFTFSWTATQQVTFANNFSGSYGQSQIAPTSDYVVGITLNNAAVGTVRANQNVNTVSFTTQTANLIVQAGETLVFTCPYADSTLSTMSFTLVGQKA